MKKYPHIKFEVNQPLDEKMLEYFIFNGEPKAGFNFVDEIISIHPQIKTLLKLDQTKKKKALKIYIKDFYIQHEKDLLRSAKLFQNIWNKIENNFFSKSDKIFSCPWPDGKYKSYISILPIGPRFLDNKTFQTCWTWKKNLKSQVIHELLHCARP